jgi:hypothetical protein
MRDAEETRRFARNHLLYEVEMVVGLVRRFGRFRVLLGTPGDNSVAEREVRDIVGRNADIEAFAVHCRLLIEFLYYTPKKKNDCRATDFMASSDDWTRSMPAALGRFSKQANTDVLHPSWDRTSPSPPWDYDGILVTLTGELREFLTRADVERIGGETHTAISKSLASASEAESPQMFSLPPDELTTASVSSGTATHPVPSGADRSGPPWSRPSGKEE